MSGLGLMVASLITCYAGSNVGSSDLQALHVLRCDVESGAVKVVQSVKGLQGTTYFALTKDGRFLYSIIGDNHDRSLPGKCVRFPVVSPDGRLGPVEEVAPLPCPAPCHVTLSPDGRTFAFANYACGMAGTVDLETRRVAHVVLPNEGVGPNVRRQQRSYAHCVFYTPQGDRLGVVNLGCDRIHFFDPATLQEDVAMRLVTEPGDGPRHAIWSKDARHLFVINELASSVTSYAFSGRDFSKVGSWSTLPDGFNRWAADGETLVTKAAAIRLSHDGRLLVASNRGKDSLAFFEVGEDGRLARKAIAPLKGSFPRDFDFFPDERLMIVAHKLSDEIAVYAFDRATWSLTLVGEPLACWKPLCFVWRPDSP